MKKYLVLVDYGCEGWSRTVCKTQQEVFNCLDNSWGHKVEIYEARPMTLQLKEIEDVPSDTD